MNPFDEKAATWDDDPAKIERARAVADAIRAAVPLSADTRLLDYGAGTGLLAQALRDTVGPVTLADTSAGMRAVMEQKVASGVIAAPARVVEYDVATGVPSDDRFDAVVTLLTLHHIDDTARAVANLAGLLAPGGSLCIVDLDAEDGSFHRHQHDFHGHNGFEREALEAHLRAAGLVDVRWSICHQLAREDRSFPLFLAIGTRPR